MFASERHGCRYLEFACGDNRFLTMENDAIKLTFWLNKGADLVELRHKASDIDVMWRAPWPIPEAGRYLPPATDGLTGFFDYYPGGWQEVFANVHLAVSDVANAPLGLHGEACLLPWTYEAVEQSASRLRIRLSVRLSRMPFRLEKTVGLELGQLGFALDERIVNEGGETLPYSWGHHPAFGAPLLEAGCRIDVPQGSVADIPEGSSARYAGQRSVWPHLAVRGDGSEGGTASAGRYGEWREDGGENEGDGTDGGAGGGASGANGRGGETVDASVTPGAGAGYADGFALELPEGGSWAALRNPRLDLGVALAWEREAFPYLWLWLAYNGTPGYPFYKREYLVALEPFTVPVETLSDAIGSGRARWLVPGESATARLWCGFTSGTREVTRVHTDGQVEYGTDG